MCYAAPFSAQLARTRSLEKNRNVRTFALVALATGVAAGVFFSLARGSGSLMELAFRYLIIANGLLFLATLTIGLLYSDARRSRIRDITQQRTKTAGLLSHIHSISSARAKLTAQNLLDDGSDVAMEAQAKRTAEFLKLLVDEARSLFDEFTDHACAVSIKIITPSEHSDTPNVTTYLRDSRSEFVRRSTYNQPRPYGIDEHSPFIDIVSGRTPSDYFLSNDLLKDLAVGRYRNGNQDWPKFYNATLVVPIQAPGAITGENVAGFLCVDSLSAKFDHVVYPLMAKIVASSAYLALYELSILDNREGSGREQGAKAGNG